MFVISKSVERIITSKTGRSMSELRNLTLSDEVSLIKERTGKEIGFSKKRNKRIIGRGNPLLARKHIRTMEYVDKKIDELCKK